MISIIRRYVEGQRNCSKRAETSTFCRIGFQLLNLHFPLHPYLSSQDYVVPLLEFEASRDNCIVPYCTIPYRTRLFRPQASEKQKRKNVFSAFSSFEKGEAANIFVCMDICLSSNYQVFKMNPFSTLSDDNHEQIRKYLKFFRLKKEAMLRALQREIDEVKADRLNEDMYTREDVSDFADFLSSAVKVTTYSAVFSFEWIFYAI